MALQTLILALLPLALCSPYGNSPQEGQRISLSQRNYRQSNPFSQDIFDPTFVVSFLSHTLFIF